MDEKIRKFSDRVPLIGGQSNGMPSVDELQNMKVDTVISKDGSKAGLMLTSVSTGRQIPVIMPAQTARMVAWNLLNIITNQRVSEVIESINNTAKACRYVYYIPGKEVDIHDIKNGFETAEEARTAAQQKNLVRFNVAYVSPPYFPIIKVEEILSQIQGLVELAPKVDHATLETTPDVISKVEMAVNTVISQVLIAEGVWPPATWFLTDITEYGVDNEPSRV